MRRAWSRPIAPVPIIPIRTVIPSTSLPGFVDVAFNFGAHEPAGLVCPVLPGEDAGGHDPVEADFGERAEEVVPGHFALSDVEMLVDARLGAGRVQDVAEAGAGLVIEG